MSNDLINMFKEKLIEYEEQLQEMQAAGKREEEAQILSGLADIYFAFDDTEKALDCFNQALIIWRDLENSAREAAILMSIGLLHFVRDEED